MTQCLIADEPLELFLFSHDSEYAATAMAAGFNGIVIDWERSGKSERQSGWNTEINAGTEADLIAMRQHIVGTLICRVDNEPGLRVEQVRRAADLGANEVWLPMVRSVGEVEECLAALPDHCSLGILVETTEALALAEQWNDLPLTRVYVGLNDLQIETARSNLFSPLCDGTVEAFRRRYHRPFGVAGVTRPDKGYPIPCYFLLAEMARLSCNFAVARRSFRADVPRRDLSDVTNAIRQSYAELRGRDAQAIGADHRALRAHVEAAANEVAPQGR